MMLVNGVLHLVEFDGDFSGLFSVKVSDDFTYSSAGIGALIFNLNHPSLVKTMIEGNLGID